jgi:GLTT repeat-containing protein
VFSPRGVYVPKGCLPKGVSVGLRPVAIGCLQIFKFRQQGSASKGTRIGTGRMWTALFVGCHVGDRSISRCRVTPIVAILDLSPGLASPGLASPGLASPGLASQRVPQIIHDLMGWALLSEMHDDLGASRRLSKPCLWSMPSREGESRERSNIEISRYRHHRGI